MQYHVTRTKTLHHLTLTEEEFDDLASVLAYWTFKERDGFGMGNIVATVVENSSYGCLHEAEEAYRDLEHDHVI